MRDYPVRTEDQLAIFLQSFRKARGLTQAELAVRLGITQQTLSDMERNAASASAGRLMRVLAALEVDLVLRDKRVPADAPAAPHPDGEPRW
jgi:HTH-type transcriptional regulator/antitoxin HipB